MKYQELPASIRRRATHIKMSPDGDVLEFRVRLAQRKPQPDKPETTPIPHQADNPLCACAECDTLYQAADGG